MPQMKTLKPLRYAGRSLGVGDPFEARPGHARLLVAIRRAEIVADDAPEPVPAVADGDPDEHDDEAQAPAEPAAQGDPKPKRKYKRRDMTAE